MLIFAAILNRDINLLESLLPEGIQEVNERGVTALHVAAVKDYTDIMTLLLNAGISINAVNNLGWTAMIAAIRADSLNGLKLLISAGASMRHALHYAAKYGRSECLGILIESGVDINEEKDGCSALITAINNNKSSSVRFLLKAGADPSRIHFRGRTALHHAATCENTDCLKLLLEEKADLEKPDDDGRTPLHHAADGLNQPASLRMLLDAGANVNARDKDGRTPLQLAIIFNFEPSIATLLLFNPDVSDCNHELVKDYRLKLLEAKVAELEDRILELRYSPFPGDLYLETKKDYYTHAARE